MSTKMLELKDEFTEKRAILENARTVLKSEFIGIDKIIDEVIDNVSSWYILSDIQEKPIVINLWGLTGVGKTSMVSRLVELINFKNKYFRFDLGEKTGMFSFRQSISELCENSGTSPIIIALDEFQHSRTVTGPFREEKDTDNNRMVWELVDSGIIQHVEWKRGLWAFENLIETLSHLLTAGVEVENGMVVSEKELFCRETDESQEVEKALLFVSGKWYGHIIDFAGDRLELHLQQDVQKILLSLSAAETIFFLKKVFNIANRPSEKNFSKSLIFVLGNLDEAYTMSSNFSADMDADEFYKQSLKITIPKIKNALQQRFRDEQIARLGNIHIIYPALSRKAYLKIIQNELAKTAENLFRLTGLYIEFDETVTDLIYSEGVYPTQGVRPIFTTIQSVLKSKFTLFLSEIPAKDLTPTKLQFSVKHKSLKCAYYSGNTVVYEKETTINTMLADIRQNSKDDMQSIIAVHESGHAILSAVLLQTIPEVIYSISSDADSQGFVFSKLAWNYTSRKELIPRVAMMLGGYAAEEIIFGKEHVTSGASGDIQKATEFISFKFKKSGMGKTPISYSLPFPNGIETYHNFQTVEEEIKEAIEQGLELAKATLTKEKKLLLAMSDYLSDNRMLKKPEIEELINTHISKPISFITNGENLFYRNHLKKSVAGSEIQQSAKFENTISLNRERE